MSGAFTYSGNPAGNAKDAVRFLVGDTESIGKGKSATDGEIAFALANAGIANPSGPPAPKVAVLMAAREVADALAARYGKEATYSLGPANEQANQKSQEFRKTARELEKRIVSYARPYVGGLSRSEKSAARIDPDREQPAFRRRLFDFLQDGL